ncbi:MAG: helix-turn-helix domain-containing protein [Gemmatimonadota bacterium]|nr:helix-turn-helix domain-containing protein [Gemmatimonadota bacterium]
MGRRNDREKRTEPTGGSRVVDALELGGSKVSIVEFGAEKRLPRHYHETACLTVVLAGRFAERFDRREHVLDEGTILAKPPGEPHSDEFGRAGSRQAILEYDPEALATLPPSHPFHETTELKSLKASLLGKQIAREISSPDDFAPLAVRGLSLELVALSSRAIADPPRQAPPWLVRVCDLLHARFLEAPTCEDLAAEAGVHPATLSRAFRECYGTGMAEYARRIRLEWAARQLSETDRPIATIAHASGFTDQSHFTRWFRRFSGETPLRYRALHGGRP